jgi:hypothetical protein
MNPAGKSIAWICICSTLFMGCYSSAMISTIGEDRGLIYTNTIETVITKDSTECKFDSPPVVVSDTTVRKRSHTELSGRLHSHTHLVVRPYGIQVSGTFAFAVATSLLRPTTVIKYITATTNGMSVNR